MQLVVFSKHLQTLSVAEAGARVKALGFQGLDLTVRPGGHILPERVREDLPRAVAELRAQGLDVPMITTAITAADEPHADATLAMAAELGIREIKLGYWMYRPFGRLMEQLAAAQLALDGLERLARRRNVRVSVHNHSGNYLSAECAVVHMLLRDRDPHHVGAYLDPGHITLEGGLSGWMQGIDILQRHLSMVAVKTFAPFSEQGSETGEVRWRHKIVPLKEGTVRWREVFRCLKQVGWDGVVTFHSEYQGSGSFRDLNVEELLVQTREDLGYLRPIIREAGYAV